MVIKRILCAALLLAGLMSSAEVNAQTTRWTGTDINTLNDGDVVFFYNVGTGRFLIHGGDWGTQVRLFNEDWGRAFTYRTSVTYNGRTKSGHYFDTGVLTNGDAKYLGCNVPLLTSQHDWTGNNDAETWTLLMDARVFSGYHAASTSSGRPGWTFTRVDEGDGTFTYYMSEHLTYQNVDSTCYLGVAYGENWKGHEGDPGGNLALLSSSFDKAVWSTANPTQSVNYVNGVKNAVLEGLEAGTTRVTRNMGTEVPIFNVDTKIPLRDLYKWRIVTRAQIEATINDMDAGDGLSVNLSYLITDPGFERNDWNFYDNTTGWKTGRVTGVTYPTANDQRRYAYTWGYENTGGDDGTNQQSNPQRNEPWNAPVRLKTQWTDKGNAKYGFMEFEGAGTVSSYIEAPATGWYRVSVYGFYSGSNEAYLFATTTNPQGTSAVNTSGFTKSALYQENSSPFLNADKETEDQVLAAGGVFINNYADKQKYYSEVDIYVTGGTKIYFGVGKNGATQSDVDVDGRTYDYYHDTDWVGVDQFSINYLGNDIVVFDEDEESLNYLKETNGADKQYNNQTVRLKRTMVTGAWNSFVFPLDLTAVQVRAAFGNNTRLAKLNTLGRAEDPQQSPYYIDFVTIPLPAEGTALNAGEFYLIQPEYNPTVGTDYSYYTMGRSTFNTGDFTATAETVIIIAEGMTHENKAKSKGTYVRTKNYDSFDKDNPTVPYVPKSYEQDGVIYGSYVLGKASPEATTTDMYRLKNNMRIKGFRGWIEDVPLGASAKVIFNGVYDNDETTNIEGTIVTPSRITDNRIYSISGQLVNCDENALNTLPKGMYIINGKKFVIK